MRYHLLTVGKLRRGFYKSACDHYLGRLAAYAKVEVVEVKEGRGATPEAVKAAEAEALRKHLAGRLVALDERGRSFRSRELAEHLSALELRGDSRLSLVVGGAEGLAPELRERADERWRLSDLTLPHELARLLLLEQLYRAETIRAGHPYHRE